MIMHDSFDVTVNIITDISLGLLQQTKILFSWVGKYNDFQVIIIIPLYKATLIKKALKGNTIAKCLQLERLARARPS